MRRSEFSKADHVFHMLAAAQGLQQRFVGGGVDFDDHQRLSAFAGAEHLHGGDIHTGLGDGRRHPGDDAGLIRVWRTTRILPLPARKDTAISSMPSMRILPPPTELARISNLTALPAGEGKHRRIGMSVGNFHLLEGDLQPLLPGDFQTVPQPGVCPTCMPKRPAVRARSVPWPR